MCIDMCTGISLAMGTAKFKGMCIDMCIAMCVVELLVVRAIICHNYMP